MPHDNWETPPDLVRRLQHEFSFDLDAAASPENAICPTYITQEDDALVRPWHGRSVWCNPPYSMLGTFTGRALSESQRLQNQIVLLIPAYTDTKWWRDHVLPANEIRFLTGRLRFWEGGSPGKDTARFPSALIIYKTLCGTSTHNPHIRWWDWRVTP